MNTNGSLNLMVGLSETTLLHAYNTSAAVVFVMVLGRTAASTRVYYSFFLLLEYSKLSASGYHFHFRSSTPVIFGSCGVADGHVSYCKVLGSSVGNVYCTKTGYSVRTVYFRQVAYYR